MEVRREPEPGSEVAEANIHAAGPIVTGHEPPNAPVEIPSRMYEDIVDAFHDAVAIHPNVLAVAVVPIPVDPNPARAGRNLCLSHDGPWGRRGVLRGGDGFGLLDDKHGLPVNLLRRAFLRFDNHVGRRSIRLARLPLLSVVAIV